MTAGTLVCGYVRVSTERQGDSGLGLEAQRQAITSECERRGWTLIDIKQDVLSGKTMKRPELQLALDLCRSGEAAGIVVAKLDRLSRSLVDFAGIIAEAHRDGWNLVALDLGIDLGTPSGEFFATVLAAMAQWEVRLISQRTKDGIAAKRILEPSWMPGRPTGVAEALRAEIRKMRDARLTLREIAQKLNDRSEPRPQGGAQWWPSTIASVLKGSA